MGMIGTYSLVKISAKVHNGKVLRGIKNLE